MVLQTLWQMNRELTKDQILRQINNKWHWVTKPENPDEIMEGMISEALQFLSNEGRVIIGDLSIRLCASMQEERNKMEDMVFHILCEEAPSWLTVGEVDVLIANYYEKFDSSVTNCRRMIFHSLENLVREGKAEEYLAQTDEDSTTYRYLSGKTEGGCTGYLYGFGKTEGGCTGYLYGEAENLKAIDYKQTDMGNPIANI